MTTLTEFLLARIDEDEEAARAAAGDPAWVFDENHLHPWHGQVISDDGAIADNVNRWDAQHIARHNPARVLAECASKRRIVELAAAADEAMDPPTTLILADGALLALAQVYADHPDYDPTWKDHA